MASSTFLLYMGGPWNGGLVIGLAADLALLSAVLCTACTAVAWGYTSPCLPVSSQPARPPVSTTNPQYGFLLDLPNSTHK